MYTHQYEQWEAERQERARHEMISMRRPVQPRPVAMETADGWMVISKLLRTSSVKPPYRYQYDADHWLTLEEAHEHYARLEQGEIRGWSPVAIVPCLKGVPLGSKKVLP